MNAGLRKYYSEEDITLASIMLLYSTNIMIENIRLVTKHIDRGKPYSIKYIYKVLLYKTLSIDDQLQVKDINGTHGSKFKEGFICTELDISIFVCKIKFIPSFSKVNLS